MFMSKNDSPTTHGVMGFQIKRDEALREEDLGRLKAADQLITVVLGEMQYITKLMGHRTIAPVEDLEQKIDAAYQKIDNYLNQNQQSLEQGTEPQQSAGGPPLDKHPLLPELGGINLEWDKMDPEWRQELAGEKIQDKAEMQNVINKKKEKLQNRIKNALKFANKMQNKIANKPGYRPVQKQVNELVTKYKLTLEELKNKPILKPEAPEYTPKFVPPRPSPMG